MRTLVACLVQLVAYTIKTPGYVYKLYSAFLVIFHHKLVDFGRCLAYDRLQSLHTAHPEWIWLVNKVA